LTQKLLVIGLDGADPRLVDRWLDKLPNIRTMKQRGISGKLASVNPPISASAWTSFATGLNPGQTGIFDFVRRRAGGYGLSVVRSTDLKCKTVWEILSENGFCCGVMNVPVVSWPPQTVKGFLISGMPDSNVSTFPSELSGRVKKDGWVTDLPLVGKDEDQIGRDLMSTMGARAEVAKGLLKEHNPDFAILVLTETDRAAHFLLSRRNDLLEGVYRRADELIGELRESFAPDLTMILSDHGNGPIKGTFLTNCWLLDKGFLTLEKVPEGPVSFEDAPIDWSRTKAFSFGEQGKIHINLAGREPKGVVGQDEYEPLLEHIEDELAELKLDGRTLNVKVWRKNTLYSGPFMWAAPDLVFQVQGGEYGPKTSLGHKRIIEVAKTWSADHAIDGIYAIDGLNVSHRELDASIIDLAPTILNHYGLEAKHMDGHPLFPSNVHGSARTGGN
jgi:predicted AlkP superfamily phosphohydrolase/phosphomutase